MYYACHPCWMRNQRQPHQDQDQVNVPIPEPEHEPRPEIHLPNYKRTANTSRHCVFSGCSFHQLLHVVPKFIKQMLIQKHNLYIPSSSRVCETHFTLNDWHLLLQNNNLFSNFTPDQIEDMISISKAGKSIFNFEKVEDMENVICKYWTGLTVANFLDLFNRLPPLSFNKPKNALAIYLAKLRTGETDRRLSTIFSVKRPTLTKILKKIRECLTQYFVPLFIGPQHMTHADIVRRNTFIPNALFGNDSETDPAAIAIFDGTYIFLQKSSNYLFQKKTYSLHKYDNLVKPFVICTSDGHIIDVVGPFAATQTDADIMTDLFQAEEDPYRQLFRQNDVFILDRGFRDAIPLLERSGFQIKKPESLDPGQTQLTTLQANNSRKVTLCRWVVEVINGRFKRDFKLFRQRFFNIASAHLMEDFKIAAALINNFHVLIGDSPNCREIIERVARFMDQPNNLGTLVRENHLNRQRSIFSRVDGNLPQLATFPILEFNDLLLLALGPYQVKQARSYYGEHMRQNGVYYVEVCPDLHNVVQLGGSRPQLLRGRIKSRHISQRVYYVYIVFESESSNNALEDILAYYCSCIVGNRTVGCCCHVMTIIWYLGWARHQDTMLSAPASFLDNILVRLTE